MNKVHPNEAKAAHPELALARDSATTTWVWQRLEAGRGAGSFTVDRGMPPERPAPRLGAQGSGGGLTTIGASHVIGWGAYLASSGRLETGTEIRDAASY